MLRYLLSFLLVLFTLTEVQSRRSDSIVYHNKKHVRVLDPDRLLKSTEIDLLDEKLLKGELSNPSNFIPCGSVGRPYEVGVVLVKDMTLYSDETVESYTKDVFNRWNLGNSACNNGVLIFVSVDDRKSVIVPGKGISHNVLPPSLREETLKKMRPYFKKSELYTGLSRGLDYMIENMLKKSNNIYNPKPILFPPPVPPIHLPSRRPNYSSNGENLYTLFMNLSLFFINVIVGIMRLSLELMLVVLAAPFNIFLFFLGFVMDYFFVILILLATMFMGCITATSLFFVGKHSGYNSYSCYSRPRNVQYVNRSVSTVKQQKQAKDGDTTVDSWDDEKQKKVDNPKTTGRAKDGDTTVDSWDAENSNSESQADMSTEVTDSKKEENAQAKDGDTTVDSWDDNASDNKEETESPPVLIIPESIPFVPTSPEPKSSRTGLMNRLSAFSRSNSSQKTTPSTDGR